MATTNPKRHRAGSDRGAILNQTGSTALFVKALLIVC